VRRLACAMLAFPLLAAPAQARETVDASAPVAYSVTIYRDPERGPGEAMSRSWPRGFAMITEQRSVTLPPGEATIRFTGVAEGMVAVSAIVTGLPGGVVEQNRDANLLSPAALVNGTLGNRVTITRTDPATGRERAQDAIIRTRADGGLVIETDAGFEAVRCSGLPERLSFDGVPPGLSPQPVFSIDTHSAAGGTYQVELTYLAWGFDWQAHYVATLEEDAPAGSDLSLRLTSWLTLLNDNGQSFPDAELLVVAGTLNVTSNFRSLASPPQARPLDLTCYPLGSTAEGTPEDGPAPPYRIVPPPPPPPPPPAPIMVTASRVAMMAQEEELGALRLYRVPEPVTVAAKGLKQVAFLQREGITTALMYQAECLPGGGDGTAQPADMRLETTNDAAHNLGIALPAGGFSLLEPSSAGELLVGEHQIPDRAAGQDLAVPLGASHQVFATCTHKPLQRGARGDRMGAVLSNAGAVPVRLRLQLIPPALGRVTGLPGTRVKEGVTVIEVDVPAAGTRTLDWTVLRADEPL